jgi:hypothetical protein
LKQKEQILTLYLLKISENSILDTKQKMRVAIYNGVKTDL